MFRALVKRLGPGPAPHYQIAAPAFFQRGEGNGLIDQPDLFDSAEQLDWRTGHYLVDASSKRCCRWCRWYKRGLPQGSGICELKRRVMADGHVWLRGVCDFFEASP